MDFAIQEKFIGEIFSIPYEPIVDTYNSNVEVCENTIPWFKV